MDAMIEGPAKAPEYEGTADLQLIPSGSGLTADCRETVCRAIIARSNAAE
jgi:hypothetical protein